MSQDPALRRLTDALETTCDDFVDATFSYLLSAYPSYYGWFPTDLTPTKKQFARAIRHVYGHVLATHSLDRRTRRFLRNLAEDHRGFGVEAGDYHAMGEALGVAARQILASRVTEEDLTVFDMATSAILDTMAQAAEEFSTVHVRWPAEVISVDKYSEDEHGVSTTVVTLAPDTPYTCQPGQFVPVRTPQGNGARVYLAPAAVPDATGHLEFHIVGHPDGELSGYPKPGEYTPRHFGGLTRAGDIWELGMPRGTMAQAVEGESHLIVAAHPAGFAAIRSLVLALVAHPGYKPRVDISAPPTCYDRRRLWLLAQGLDWLNLVEDPAELEPMFTDDPAVIISGPKTWCDQQYERFATLCESTRIYRD